MLSSLRCALRRARNGRGVTYPEGPTSQAYWFDSLVRAPGTLQVIGAVIPHLFSSPLPAACICGVAGGIINRKAPANLSVEGVRQQGVVLGHSRSSSGT